MAGKKILLVEGDDDEHVLKHLCGNLRLGHFDEVKSHGGVDNLLESFPLRLKLGHESDSFGVVIDADIDLSARWRAIRNPLVGLGYTGVPDDPMAEGTILDSPRGSLLPRVGIWIMPNNQTPGILEDFLRFLVPAESALFEHVTASVAAIPTENRLFTQVTEPKAVMHTWLAWQAEPGRPLGTAITARYLDPTVAHANTLVSWLRRLFFQ